MSAVPIPLPPVMERAADEYAAPRRETRWLDRWRRVVVVLLATIAVASIWFVGFGRVLSGVEARRSQATLHDAFRAQLALGTAPSGDKRVATGGPVARINIGALGLRGHVVVEGTDSAQLSRGVGHRRDTVLPGNEGTAVLMGRSTWFDGPLGGLADLRRGDVITVRSGEGLFRYEVESVRRKGHRMSEPLRSGEGRLTLISSESAPSSVARFGIRAVYADAKLVGEPTPPSVGRPKSLLAAEASLSGDGRAVFGLLLWLEALVVAAVVTAWTRVRWRLAPTVLVGAPVVVALLWGSMDVAARLLPNIY